MVWQSTHTHTHTFNGPLSGTTRVNRYQKGRTNLWILLKQETVSGSNISWTMCKCAPSSQTDKHPTTQFLYGPDALPAAQPTASKHWRHGRAGSMKWCIVHPSICLFQHGPWAANPLLHFCCWWAGDIDQFLWQRWTNASSASLSAYVGGWTDLFFLQCSLAVLYGSIACTDNPTKFLFLSNLQNVPLFIMSLPCYRSAPMSFSSFLFVKAANFKVGVHALRGFQFHCWLSLCDLMEMCRKCEKYRHTFNVLCTFGDHRMCVTEN